jgi:hypothetical protein
MRATVQRPCPLLNILHWQLEYSITSEQFMYGQDNTGGEHQRLDSGHRQTAIPTGWLEHRRLK